MDIIKVEKLTGEKWLNLFAATYRHNSHEGRWVFASRDDTPHRPEPQCNAVVIAAVLRDEGKPPRFVMIKEFRVPIGDYVYALPAGLLDEGESLEDTIRREMLEETGFEVTAVKRITPPLLSSAGLTDEAVAIGFVDVHSTPESKQALEGSEDIEVLLLDYAQMCTLCDDRTKRIDAKAWALLYHFQQFGRID